MDWGTRLVIRRATPEDAPQVLQVYQREGAYSGTLQAPHPPLKMWQERLTPGEGRVLLVAVLDQVIVGQAGLINEANPRRRHAAHLGLAVDDRFVGQGIGSALLAELINLADNWLHVLRLELTVFTDNAAAIALYRKFGFQLEGTHRAYALRNGELIDVHAMARLHPKPPHLPAV
jgi:L-phenylalanine/L-methionine N-acetyltransferase